MRPNDITTTRQYDRGDIVSYAGLSAVVHEAAGSRARIGYHDDLPERECDVCGGSGSVPQRGSGTTAARAVWCPTCSARGTLPPTRVVRIRWVDVGELGPAPERTLREQDELAEIAGQLFANPRAVLEGGER